MLTICLVASLLAQSPSESSCVSSGGSKECGYHCVARDGQARCAKTPDGICLGAEGKIVCFDPSPGVRTVYKSLPRPTCKQGTGAIACGYACAQLEGQVACAKTPAGVCEARYGKVQCFDPGPEVFAVWGADPPRPSCDARNDRIACGYGCKANAAGSACAKTPAGTCAELGGQVVCGDPKPRVLCAFGKDTPAPKCRGEGQQRACGYDCQYFNGDLKCAETPAGKCTERAGSGTTCFDPPLQLSEKCAAVLAADAVQ